MTQVEQWRYFHEMVDDYPQDLMPLCPFADTSVEMGPGCMSWKKCRSCAWFRWAVEAKETHEARNQQT